MQTIDVFGKLLRSRLWGYVAITSVFHELEYSSGVRRGKDRFLRIEGFQRHQPVVLIIGGKENGEATSIQVQEAPVIYETEELHSILQAALSN